MAHNRQYKTSSMAVIRCPMVTTCQTDMDFGAEHNTAMDASLKRFYFRSPTSPHVAGVQEFLRANAMECIVWACSLAHTPDDKLPPPVQGTSPEMGDNIDEEEKDRIRAVQLDESKSKQEGSEEVEPITAIEDSDGQCKDSDVVSTYTDQWGKSLESIEHRGNLVSSPLKSSMLSTKGRAKKSVLDCMCWKKLRGAGLNLE